MSLRRYQLDEPITVRQPKRGPIRDGGRADNLRPVPKIAWDTVDRDVILSNQFVRLNTCYQITSDDGVKTDFFMKPEQYDFFRDMHAKNIILKSRQIGFTTLIQLYLLDIAMFREHTACGVIAHTKEDAEKFFKNKIKFAWENFPPDIKDYLGLRAEQDASGVLMFSNGSSISVGTSMRSTTLQYLHISEFGKLCAKFPEKAAEVVSGALNTVSPNNFVVIESTGEGTHGHFYEMCQRARRLADRGAELSPMDYKFFFYPWWTDPKYTLNHTQDVSEEDRNYFHELDRASNIRLTREQRNWYVVKRQEQQERMWREYPSTPDEAFRGVIDGAPLARSMSQLRRLGRITRVPFSHTLPVVTFWDLGRNDKTAIWFMQRAGFENRFIDYFEDRQRPLEDYAAVLNRKPYRSLYSQHYLPHDAEVIELTQTDSLSRREILQRLLPGECLIVPRIATEEDGVNAVRQNLGNCWFDEERCATGVLCLEQVRYKFDERLQEFQPNLLRNAFKHGYDAFMQFGHGYRHRAANMVGGKMPAEEDLAEISQVSRASRHRAANRADRPNGRF